MAWRLSWVTLAMASAWSSPVSGASCARAGVVPPSGEATVRTRTASAAKPPRAPRDRDPGRCDMERDLRLQDVLWFIVVLLEGGPARGHRLGTGRSLYHGSVGDLPTNAPRGPGGDWSPHFLSRAAGRVTPSCVVHSDDYVKISWVFRRVSFRDTAGVCVCVR